MLAKLANRKFENLTPELRQNILAFYTDPAAPIATKKDRDDWQKTVRALDQLKATRVQARQAAKQ